MTQTRPTSTAAIGWSAFASFTMGLLGIWWVIAGIAGIAKDDVFLVTNKYVFKFSVTAWGWIHLLVGLAVAVVGACLWAGQTWARWTGLVIVALSMIANFAWIPYYPVWGIVVLALDGAVIWALSIGSSQDDVS